MRTGRPPRIPDHVVQELRSRVDAGERTAEVARELGIALGTAYALVLRLSRRGGPPRSASPAPRRSLRVAMPFLRCPSCAGLYWEDRGHECAPPARTLGVGVWTWR